MLFCLRFPDFFFVGVRSFVDLWTDFSNSFFFAIRDLTLLHLARVCACVRSAQFSDWTKTEQAHFKEQVDNWCQPGKCAVVPLDACNAATFKPLFGACRELWKHRGALVSSSRAQLVSDLHRLVLDRCQLQLWSADAQYLLFDKK